MTMSWIDILSPALGRNLVCVAIGDKNDVTLTANNVSTTASRAHARKTDNFIIISLSSICSTVRNFIIADCIPIRIGIDPRTFWILLKF